jgi:uncharacterized membrane protein YbaN (DUF454 family)
MWQRCWNRMATALCLAPFILITTVAVTRADARLNWLMATTVYGAWVSSLFP